MVCSKCGNKVNENDIYCPICSAKLEKKKEHKVFRDIKIKFNLVKGRFITLALLIVIIAGGLFIYLSPGGKYFIAGIMAESRHYDVANNIIDSINDEKSYAKQEYYSLMKVVDSFVASKPELNYAEDMTDKEVEDAHWGETNETTYCSIEDYNSIVDKVNLVNKYNTFLSAGEKTRLDNINSCIQEFNSNADYGDFNSYLTNAYKIYTVAENLSNGNSFSPSAILDVTEDMNSDLSAATEIFAKYKEYSFYGCKEISQTIQEIKDSMEENGEIYGYSSTINFKKFTYIPSPYDNGQEDISKLTEDLKLIIIKSYFDSRCSM